MRQREEAKKAGKAIKKRIRSALGLVATPEQVKAAEETIATAVFGSIYTEGKFEHALENHQKTMLELGEEIDSELKEFEKQWKKYEKRGPHAGHGHRKNAITHLEQVVSLEEEIDKHFKKFQEKLDILTSWRQFKIENDIGEEIDTEEVYEWLEEEVDVFDIEEDSFEKEEAQEVINASRGTDEREVSKEAQEMLNGLVEDTSEAAEVNGVDETEPEVEIGGTSGGGDSSGVSQSRSGGKSSGSNSSEDDVDIDAVVEEFRENEL